jgi:folate-binding protein YgfZ
LNAHEVVADYGDVAAEEAALTSAAGVLDLSFRGRLCLLGKDRARLLHGQVTNDVLKLSRGMGCYAALVTAKGRLESDLNIHALENELLLDFEPGLTERIVARLDHYVVADDVQIVDVVPHYGLLSVQGPMAAEVLSRMEVFPILPKAAFAVEHVSEPAVGDLYLVHRSRTGWPAKPATAPGFDVYVPTEALGMVFDKAVAAARAVGGRAVGWTALEHRRIAGGVPRFGSDLDESNLAPEGGETFVAHGISYAKGCYIGQEVIARIRTYGQVTRALRGVRFLDDSRDMVARGAKLLKDGKEVGRVTSGYWSEAHAAVIALGLVRKECNAIGTELQVAAGDEMRTVRVVEIPFTA